MRAPLLKNRYIFSALAALVSATVVASGVSAQTSVEGEQLSRQKLTGDWFQRRSFLEDNGVAVDVSSTQYYQGTARGGLEQAFQYGGRNDYFLNLDGAKLGYWEGASLLLHGESRYGESVNTLGGTLLAPNFMLSVPRPADSVTALTSVTFTQSLSDNLLVYFGKLNTQEDVQQPLTGANNVNGFQNTAMLYNPVYARTVPYSTYGAGLSFLHDEDEIFGVCVYDTNDSTTESGFDTFFNNGATIYAGTNLPTSYFDLPGHHGLAGTYSSGSYTNLSPSPYLDPIAGLVFLTPVKSGSWSLTYNVDQAIYVSPEDEDRVWGVFGNFGIADSNPSPVRWFASAGVSGASQIAGRKADSFGIATFYLGVSEALKDLAPVLLPLRDEYGVEAYYNISLVPWCHITPDIQAIRPFRQRAETSLIFGLRAGLDF